MNLEIENKVVNPLFNRTEITFKVKHDAETPSRASVIKEIAKALNADESLIVVDYIRQPFGIKMCYGRAKIYKSESDMLIEKKHIIERVRKSLGKTGGEKKEEAAPGSSESK